MNRFASITIAILSLFGIFASQNVAQAANELPFTDVTLTDDYYYDLLSLYRRGVISDNSEHRFYPDSIMRRDEFVSIVVGIGCVRCLSPAFEDIVRYNTIPFIDFERKNPNFYCVSYAKDRGIVEWYVVKPGQSYACQNGTSYNETPFCADNKISRIEAVAVLLRQAKLWNEVLNSQTFDRHETFSDVNDRWFGYAQKWVDVGILQKAADNSIKPDEFISKKEFVRMASRIFSANMCTLKGDGSSLGFSLGDWSYNGSNTWSGAKSLSVEIIIFDKQTSTKSATNPKTAFPNTKETTYDFLGHTENKGNFSYDWQFIRLQDGKLLKSQGEWLDNFTLDGAGTWYVKLTLNDSLTGQSATAYASVEVTSGQSSIHGLSVTANANVLSTYAPSEVKFSSSAKGWVAPYTYRWDFGDGTFSGEENPTHLYQYAGTYQVTLTVRDKEWSTGIAALVVSMDENLDTDNDGVANSEDLCPYVKWPPSNKGCPLIRPYGFWDTGTDATKTLSLSSVGSICLYENAENNGAIYGSPSCTSCPCLVNADFNAMIRKCDRILPSILSPEKSRSFSQWLPFEIRF